MGAMSEYEFQLDIRLDGKYYCRIYQYGIPGTVGITDDFDTDEEVIDAANEIILLYDVNNTNPLVRR